MQNTINELGNIITVYSPLLRKLTDAEFSFKPSPSKWSGKEYLGHLIDSAQNNIRRFVVAQYEDKPFIVYDQEKWVEAADYQNYPANDLIDFWILINKHLLMLLKNMPADAYERKVQTQDIHPVWWLAADYNKHLLHHLHQVLHMEPVAYP